MMTIKTICKTWIFGAMALFAALVLAGRAGAQEEADGQGASAKTRYVFAVSWQPAFCETRPSRAECKAQTADRFDAMHFSLHGLWPLKKSYCGIAADLKARDKKGTWTDLPETGVTGDVAARLKIAMPGVVSGFERHQWVKSGSCLGMTAERYFGLSLALLDRLNGSPVQALFAGNVGQTLSQAQVQKAFDTAFGTGAGDRVRMRCQKDGSRRIITGLTIGLSDALSKAGSEQDMGALILAAGTTKFNCSEGVVDATGAQ